MRRGFTLIEIVIALLVSSLLLAGFIAVVLTSSRNEGDSSLQAQLENDAHEAVTRIADELRQAGTGGPGWSFAGDAVFYNICTGYSGGSPLWDSPRLLTLAAVAGETLADSIDNNGNGLVDEGMLILSGNGIYEPLIRDVAMNGLTFTQSGNNISISITLTRMNPEGAPMSATATTLVSLRN